MSEFDFDHWEATWLLDKFFRARVIADAPPLSAVAFGAFK
jgi:hypothetical protein